MRFDDFKPPELNTIVRQYIDDDGNKIDGRKYPGGLKMLVGKVIAPGPVYTWIEYISGTQARIKNSQLRDAHDDEDYMWEDDPFEKFGF